MKKSKICYEPSKIGQTFHVLNKINYKLVTFRNGRGCGDDIRMMKLQKIREMKSCESRYEMITLQSSG
jgi:hypothetical protein